MLSKKLKKWNKSNAKIKIYRKKRKTGYRKIHKGLESLKDIVEFTTI